MKILYVSSLCSDKYFKNIFENSRVKPQQQAQKFHSLLSKGLIELTDDLYVLSRPPIQRSKHKIEHLKTKGNLKSGSCSITYNHLKVLNIVVLKQFLLFCTSFFYALKWGLKNRKQEKAIFFDPLNLSISVAAMLVAKILNVKSVAIVTDIPDFMEEYTFKKKSFINRATSKCYTGICNFLLHKYDYYILLTEQMNEVINFSKKPYIVMEGLVDSQMKNTMNLLDYKYNEKIVIYAGALYEKYGVKKLIDAFMKLKDSDVKLWLYGAGEMEDYVKKCEKEDYRIKYFGVVPNELIVKEQLKATLLVNPRPSYEDFTKYSFPSKNMEYMVSGTPILTTRLQGMPSEYNKYVYLIEDETVSGVKSALETILGKNREELHEQGVKAKEFVISEKNNQVQASKIINFISA